MHAMCATKQLTLLSSLISFCLFIVKHMSKLPLVFSLVGQNFVQLVQKFRVWIRSHFMKKWPFSTLYDPQKNIVLTCLRFKKFRLNSPGKELLAHRRVHYLSVANKNRNNLSLPEPRLEPQKRDFF